MSNFSKKSITLFLSALALAAAMPALGEAGEFDCLIEPHMVVDVGTPEHGIIEAIGVDRSDVVNASDVLAQLESGEQRATVRKARASAGMESEIKARQAALDLAQRKQARIQELFSSNAISTHQRDEVDTEVTVAQMQLAQARENRSLALIELDRARTDLERRTIRSPISGIVVERFVAPGEYVHEKPLLRVAQMHPLRVEAIAPAAVFGSIKTGMRAEVITENDAGHTYTAQVTIVDQLIDPASGTFGIRLELPNPDYKIPSGLNCHVRILPPAPVARPASTTPATTPAKARSAKAETDSLATGENVCRTFGPFKDDAGRDEFFAALGDRAHEVGRRDEAAADSTAGYFVLTPAAKNMASAHEQADALRNRGIHDLAILTRAPNRGRISLGLFRQQDRAQKQRDALAAVGVETQVVPRVLKQSRLWLDVELPSKLATQVAQAQDVTSTPCAADYVRPLQAVAAGTVK